MSERHPRYSLRGDVRVAAAAVLTVLALGLPWTISTVQYIPGWYVAGSCVNEFASNTLWCTPGFSSPGMYAGAEAVVGAHSVARVFLVAALIILVLAAGRRTWILAAAATITVGLLVAGVGSQAGQIAAIGAIALLLSVGLRAPVRDTVRDVLSSPPRAGRSARRA